MGNEYEEIRNRFLRLEEELELFSLKIRGVRIWERIRNTVYRDMLAESGLIKRSNIETSLPQGGGPTKYPHSAYKWTKNLIIKNPFFVRQRDFLFLGHQRRKKLGDGYWWDIYCDPITENNNIDYVHLENLHLGSHKKPARTGNLKYLEFIQATGLILRKLGFANVSLTTSEKERIQKITEAFEGEFGVSMEFESMIRSRLSSRKSVKWMYKILIKKVDPDIVVVVVGYDEVRKRVIEACRENDVPVVELQHGVIHKSHMAYHYPDEVDVPSFPDYIFTFGEYWCDCVNYPIDDDKVIPVGYPYLEFESKKYAEVEESDQIIFISQTTIGEELSKFAVELDKRVEDYEIVYKLHPGEYDRWRGEYPWLQNSDLRVVDSEEPPLYRLFAKSNVQVGVGSTAVYEGLNFDLDTYLLDIPAEKHKLKPLIEQGYVEEVSSPEELLNCLENNGSQSFDAEKMFKSDAVKNISEAFDEIIDSMR